MWSSQTAVKRPDLRDLFILVVTCASPPPPPDTSLANMTIQHNYDTLSTPQIFCSFQKLIWRSLICFECSYVVYYFSFLSCGLLTSSRARVPTHNNWAETSYMHFQFLKIYFEIVVLSTFNVLWLKATECDSQKFEVFTHNFSLSNTIVNFPKLLQ